MDKVREALEAIKADLKSPLEYRQNPRDFEKAIRSALWRTEQALSSLTQPQPEAKDEDCEECDLLRGEPCPGCKRFTPQPEAREEDIGKLLVVIRSWIDCYRGLGQKILREAEQAESNFPALFRLAAKEGQGWISVKDRLPEERGKYLCCFHGNGQEVLYWDIEDWCDRIGLRDPSYWMPLPAAPATSEKPEDCN